MDEGMASFIQCPGTDCNILVEDDLVLGLIASEKRYLIVCIFVHILKSYKGKFLITVLLKKWKYPF